MWLWKRTGRIWPEWRPSTRLGDSALSTASIMNWEESKSLPAAGQLRKAYLPDSPALLSSLCSRLTVHKNMFESALRDSALSSAVEHYLHTVGVAGSKPAARTIQ